MLEKMNGAKVWMMVGALLLLNACANTDKGALNNASTDPVIEDTTSETMGTPREGVDEETMGGSEAGSQEELDNVAGSLIYFGYDRYDLSSDARSALQAQARWMEGNSSYVTVEGHCDERGTREYNLALGDRRANAVKNYLVALGVSSSRIRTVSYGKERPAVIGTGSTAWAKNRRGYTRVN